MTTPRFGFAGTAEFAADFLGGLLQCNLRPSLILSGPDRRRGRGRQATRCPVRRLALAEGLAAKTPATKNGAVAAIKGEHLQVMVVAAYGLILPRAFLDMPRFGCINVHASLLPRWRGAAPIERALMAGDEETGTTIMQMDEGLDTGPIIAQTRLAIGRRSTGAELSRAIVDLSVELLRAILLTPATMKAQPQQGEASYAHKLKPQEAAVDWRLPAAQLDRAIRALAHRMPMYGLLGGVRVQLLEAEVVAGEAGAAPGEVVRANRQEIRVACGDGALRLNAIRLDRGKGSILGPAEAVNGFRDLFQPSACFCASANR